MIKNALWLLLILPLLALCGACASNHSTEIGDPSLSSPEQNVHYSTIYDAFSRYDTNADGYLDEHEFAQLQQDPKIVAIRASIPELAGQPPMLFNEVDEDGDGNISLNELTVIAQPLLPKSRQ